VRYESRPPIYLVPIETSGVSDAKALRRMDRPSTTVLQVPHLRDDTSSFVLVLFSVPTFEEVELSKVLTGSVRIDWQKCFSDRHQAPEALRVRMMAKYSLKEAYDVRREVVLNTTILLLMLAGTMTDNVYHRSA